MCRLSPSVFLGWCYCCLQTYICPTHTGLISCSARTRKAFKVLFRTKHSNLHQVKTWLTMRAASAQVRSFFLFCLSFILLPVVSGEGPVQCVRTFSVRGEKRRAETMRAPARGKRRYGEAAGGTSCTHAGRMEGREAGRSAVSCRATAGRAAEECCKQVRGQSLRRNAATPHHSSAEK